MKNNHYISMSQKELDKLEIIKKSLRKEIIVQEAAKLIDLSERQVYRLRAKIKEQGAQGLVHGNRGKSSNHRMPVQEQEAIVKLLNKYYADFRPTHASEKLAEKHNLTKHPTTIRQIMIQAGLWQPRKQRRANYYSRRPRQPFFGQMIQFDGSYEYWFESRGPKCCLLASIDDATNTVAQGLFVDHEGVFPVFEFWQDYFLKQGKPRSIYLDKLRTYYNNHSSTKDDEEMLSQFQRAMKELGIKLIVAHSPQAKGRVERLFGTLQDRLIKEMRLKGIANKQKANQFLKQEFLPWFNAKYSRRPLKQANLHQKLTRQEKKELVAILSRQSVRVVQNDFTIRFENKWYQLLKDQPVTIRQKDKIIIEGRLDGSIKIRIRDKYLNYKPFLIRPKQYDHPWIIAAKQEPKPKTKQKTWKPGPNHPWKRYPAIQTHYSNQIFLN